MEGLATNLIDLVRTYRLKRSNQKSLALLVVSARLNYISSDRMKDLQITKWIQHQMT
jgi:hypothetical protein